MRNVLLVLLLAVVAHAGPEDWSEPVMIADGEEYSHYDQPSFDLHTDISYTTISRYWDGTSKINYIKYDQYGNVLIGPKLILDTADDTRPKVCVILNNDFTFVFYYKDAGVIYYMAIYNGNVIIEPRLFIATNNVTNQSIAVAKEDNNTIHIIYPMINTTFLVGYTRWNPDTGERLDIEGIVVDDSRVDDQHFGSNGYFDIAVDSEGNVHIFFDQTLYFDWLNYSTNEVCWARVDDDSTGEYTSRILSTFYTDGHDDTFPHGTVDNNDDIHVIWKGYINDEICAIYYSMTNEGVEITSQQQALDSPWDEVLYGFPIQYNNGNLAIVASYENRFISGKMDLDGDIIENLDYTTDNDIIFEPDQDSERYLHHNNGFINIVWASNDNLYYQHTLDGMDTVDPAFRADQSDDGLLLTWREDSSSASATWSLQRDGDELVELAGEADYAYLDRNVDPGVTYSYTLRATKPDGEARTFGPVEAAWRDDSQTKLTLDAPYPSPAADSVSLDYTLPEGCATATLTIYDLAGRRLTTQQLDPTPGRHSLTLDVEDYPPGTYLARLDADATTTTRRFVISR